MQFIVQRPSLWETLPSYTNFTGVVRFIGMILYIRNTNMFNLRYVNVRI